MNKQLVKIALFALGFFFLGCLFYAWQHNYIIIRTSRIEQSLAEPKKLNRKPCHIHYYAQGFWHTDTRICTLFDNQQLLLKELVTHWLDVARQELHIPINTIQTAAISYNNQELILSFEKDLFPQTWSTEHKLYLIQSLIKTVQTYFPQAHWLHILHNYKPLVDEELDFSLPWNMQLFLTDKSSYQRLYAPVKTGIKTLVIEPFCTKNKHGRKIHNSNERVVTMRYAYLIKRLIEFNFPYIECLVSRSDAVSELQRINQLVLSKPDLVLKLGAYEQEDQLHHISFYHYSNMPNPQALALNDFIDYAQAYRVALESTLYYKQHLHKLCTQHPLARYFIVSDYTCPLSALKGLSVPSCYIEIGVSQSQSDKVIETLILDCIGQLLVNP